MCGRGCVQVHGTGIINGCMMIDDDEYGDDDDDHDMVMNW